jgi:hypothetical protein
MLMERYRRIDVAENSQITGERLQKDKYLQQYYSGIPLNDSRSYIPMSQKGTRVIKYTNSGEQADLDPSAAMRMIYN